jgi:putative transcriptional regulator
VEEVYHQLEKGTFLVSSPEIESGIFFRSVLLLCDHSDTGSFGVVVNKMLELELPPELLTGEEIKNPHVQLRAGGPMHTNQLMILHTSDTLPDQTMKIADGIYLGGDLGFLQQALNDEQGPELLLCFGYSVWQAGQLEREFLDGGWFPTLAKKEHLFHTPAEKLWQTLLLEMGGKYATMSVIPEDVSLN